MRAASSSSGDGETVPVLGDLEEVAVELARPAEEAGGTPSRPLPEAGRGNPTDLLEIHE